MAGLDFERVIVSPEMTTLIGRGDIVDDGAVADSALLVFTLGGLGAPATLSIAADGDAPQTSDGLAIACFVTKAALARLFDWSPDAQDGCRYHLTSQVRGIALALAECPMEGLARDTYRIGKSIELVCETLRALGRGSLVPVAPDGGLSQADSGRLVVARRMIDEQWSENLTLDGLARACGINRAKLTRGFRELYNCTVAEAIAERRLLEASRALRTTDLPVSSIGYANGYLNNASFSRAFGRRFGVTPSAYRGCAAVAA
jgi:AraC family transcriptional activator of pyochelin receptor